MSMQSWLRVGIAHKGDKFAAADNGNGLLDLRAGRDLR